MTRKRPRKGVSLLPTRAEAALFFVNPEGMPAAFALREYKKRTGADLTQFRAGLSLLWHRDPFQEMIT